MMEDSMARTRSVIGLTVILSTLLALGYFLTDARGQPKACGSEIHPLDVNQTTLHYFECGKGEPLVFVHGGLGDLHTFQRQLQTFATSFRIIAYSRRFSPPNAPPRETDVNPLSNHVADLRALITQLKATPAHLVGNSYGAYVALALAVAHPELVRSLVLGEPPVWPLLPPKPVGEGSQPSPILRAFERSLEDGVRAFMDGICGKGCFDKLPQARRTELIEKQGSELRSQFMTEPSAYMPPLDCGNLGKLARPTLLLTGERSPEVFLLITGELERCLEGESKVMVPEAGHGIHGDNAAFYNEAVLRFLQRR
jgi:non-heme chloroperoxidase